MLAAHDLGAMEPLEKILQEAAKRRLGQLELERLSGLSPNRISKWKAGQGEPTLSQAHRIARVLGVSLDYLADEAQEQPPARLTDDERLILELARRVGARRILDAVLSPPGPAVVTSPEQPSYADLKARRKTS